MNRWPVSLVVSTRNPEEINYASRSGCDLIEIRLDQCSSLEPDNLDPRALPPLILTVRSREEGGAFEGTPAAWFSLLEPWLDLVVYVDVESAYQEYSARLQQEGKKVIASWHTRTMPTTAELGHREHALRSFGDIPKIVVTPGDSEDLLTLLAFTLHARKPICTGIMGSSYRYGRILLPLFGSQLAYCHAGTPLAEGQYHIEDFRAIFGRIFG